MILNISPFVKLKMLSEQVVVKIRDFMNCVPSTQPARLGHSPCFRYYY